MSNMAAADFDILSGVIYKRAGIVLSREKEYLLESRLMPLVRSHGFGGLDELAGQVRNGGDEALLREVTEAMTTNETLFFRDIKPFDQFRDVIVPYLLANRSPSHPIRIWSAAASTGQEAYSLAMVIKELGGEFARRRIEILGTDLSREALDKARVGIYSQFEIQRGLPIKMLMKYFKQTNEIWQIDSALRAMVNFRELNLLDDFSALGKFDIVYCRNVLIYFDKETKADILNRISAVLRPDGFLGLGGAETIIGVTDAFRRVPDHRGLYEPAPRS